MLSASWNMRTLTDKLIELVKALHRHKINIPCIQGTKWVDAKAKKIDRYKLGYSGCNRAKNRVGILVKKRLVE